MSGVVTQVPYAHHYGLSPDVPTGIEGYLAALDAYELRLREGLAAAAAEAAGAAAQEAIPRCFGIPSLFLRNRTAMEALSLPRYVFDGQIEGKLPFSSR